VWQGVAGNQTAPKTYVHRIIFNIHSTKTHGR
jgi:hypothetical protein